MRKCIRCNSRFVYNPEECKWDYNGTEPVKIVQCPECATWNPIRYEAMQNVNNDKRYYFFDKATQYNVNKTKGV